MTTFWIVTGIMMMIGVVLVLPAVFKRKSKVKMSHKELNVLIYQQRIDELEEEKDNGVLDAGQYDQARLELDRSLLNDLSGVNEEGKINNLSGRGKWLTLLSVLILVPALSTPLYLHLGKPELLVSQKDINPANMDQNSMLSAINSLVTRLKKEPDNIDGWKLLGRSYYSLNRMDDSIRAYENALKLNGQDPDLLVDYAEILMNTNEGDPSGLPERLINKAILISPDHEKALWLSGIVRHYYRDYDGTLEFWRKLLSMQSKGSEQEAFLNENISKVLAAKGVTSTEHPVAQDRDKVDGLAGQADTGSGSITVTVNLDSKFKDKANGNEIVFIYAKAVAGPPMPLAVVRKRVSDLPITVTLDDSMAMVPIAKISKFKDIRVSAHISRSGQANRQSGDLFGTSGSLNVASTQKTEIIINQAMP